MGIGVGSQGPGPGSSQQEWQSPFLTTQEVPLLGWQMAEASRAAEARFTGS